MQNLERASSNPRTEATNPTTLLPPFLTDAELRRIADPLKQPAAITRWFQRSGFEVKRKPNGMPLVSRAHFEHVMCGHRPGPAGDDGSDAAVSPDATALLKRFAQNSKRKVC